MFNNVLSDRETESQALAHIRRESLDLYNRIHSIDEDCGFVQAVSEAYKELPLVRKLNSISERCVG